MNQSFNVENTKSRERLYKLTAELSESDLNQKLPSGWSVATALVHLSFWDRYYLAILEEWERSGYIPSRLNVDAINDSIEFISLSVPPLLSVQLVRTAADRIDLKLKDISSDLAKAIEESGYERLLQRYFHRGEHLDQIELALKSILQ